MKENFDKLINEILPEGSEAFIIVDLIDYFCVRCFFT